MLDKVTRYLVKSERRRLYSYLRLPGQLGSTIRCSNWLSCPEEAISELSENKHDICLLDYRLGASDGLEVLKRAVANGFRGPIIMLTGQSDEALDSAALDAGAVDYLVKNEMSTGRFARAIRYALARRDVEDMSVLSV